MRCSDAHPDKDSCSCKIGRGLSGKDAARCSMRCEEDAWDTQDQRRSMTGSACCHVGSAWFNSIPLPIDPERARHVPGVSCQMAYTGMHRHTPGRRRPR